MIDKKERIDAVFREFKLAEDKICSEVGMGLDSFKGENWKNHRMDITPECSVSAFQYMIEKFSAYVSETLHNEGPGIFDLLICLRKVDIQDAAAEMKKFEDLDEKRKVIVEEAKKKMQAIEDEFFERSQLITEADEAYKDESI